MNEDIFIPSDPDPKPEEAINIDIIAPEWFTLSRIGEFEKILNRRERNYFHSKRIYRVYPHGITIVGLGIWQVLRNTWYRLLLRRTK